MSLNTMVVSFQSENCMRGKFTSLAKIPGENIGRQFSFSEKNLGTKFQGGKLRVKFQDTSQDMLFFLGT